MHVRALKEEEERIYIRAAAICLMQRHTLWMSQEPEVDISPTQPLGSLIKQNQNLDEKKKKNK